MRPRKTGEVEWREGVLDDVNIARRRRRRVSEANPGRAPLIEAGIELLRDAVGQRRRLVDMRDHRRAPADLEPPLLGGGQPSPSQHQQFRRLRSGRLEKALCGVEHAPVERPREPLLGAERDHQMSAPPRAARRRSRP